jgi:hypothetical protein
MFSTWPNIVALCIKCEDQYEVKDVGVYYTHITAPSSTKIALPVYHTYVENLQSPVVTDFDGPQAINILLHVSAGF